MRSSAPAQCVKRRNRLRNELRGETRWWIGRGNWKAREWKCHGTGGAFAAYGVSQVRRPGKNALSRGRDRTGIGAVVAAAPGGQQSRCLRAAVGAAVARDPPLRCSGVALLALAAVGIAVVTRRRERLDEAQDRMVVAGEPHQQGQCEGDIARLVSKEGSRWPRSEHGSPVPGTVAGDG